MSDGAIETDKDNRPSSRKDGRRSLLVYMQPDLIKALKKVAVDSEVTVFSIVEEAVQEWMERREKRIESD
jgi:hypothetical protein